MLSDNDAMIRKIILYVAFLLVLGYFQSPLNAGELSPGQNKSNSTDKGKKIVIKVIDFSGSSTSLQQISLASYGRRLGDILLELGSEAGYTVIFGAQVDANLPVVADLRGVTLTKALDAITGYVNYGYEVKDKTITVQKVIAKNFSIPDISITSPNMTAEMGGDMVGGSNGTGSSGTSSGYGGSSSSDTGSQNLKANVTLKKAADTVDGRKMFEENIKKLLSADGHYVVDWLAADLMVVDSPRNISLIGRYIEGLRESSDKLLVVEATISEVTTNADLKFGIDWSMLINSIGGTHISRPGGIN